MITLALKEFLSLFLKYSSHLNNIKIYHTCIFFQHSIFHLVTIMSVYVSVII